MVSSSAFAVTAAAGWRPVFAQLLPAGVERGQTVVLEALCYLVLVS